MNDLGTEALKVKEIKMGRNERDRGTLYSRDDESWLGCGSQEKLWDQERPPESA